MNYEEAVFVALTAAIAACIASTLVFIQPWRDTLSHGTMPVAVVWAMLPVGPRFSLTVGFAKRSVLAGVVGAVTATAFSCMGPNLRLLATASSFPCVLAIAACSADCGTPLRHFIWPPAGLLVHFAVLSFGAMEPRASALAGAQFVLAYASGGLAAMISHVFVVTLIYSHEATSVKTERLLGTALEQLLYTVEGAMAYLTVGGIHLEEMERRVATLQAATWSCRTAVADWRREAWSSNPEESLLDALEKQLDEVMEQVAGLVGTMKNGYTQACRLAFWEPISCELQHLRLSIVAVLRAVSRSAAGLSEDQTAQMTIENLLAESHLAVTNSWDAMARHVTSQIGNDPLLQGTDPEEVARFMFAFMVLRHFPSHVGALYRAIRDVNLTASTRSWFQPCRWCLNALQQTKSQLIEVCDKSQYFKAEPGDALLLGEGAPPLCERVYQNLRFPLRLALSSQLAVALVMLLGSKWPHCSKFGFWAVLPCLLCVLPTTGAAVVKSMRRIVGTIAGSSAALASLYFNSEDRSALLAQLFLVTFVAKYLTYVDWIDYSGLTFGFTWHIVTLAYWDAAWTPDMEFFQPPMWRSLNTILGCVVAVIGSIVLFPNHASKELQHEFAEVLPCIMKVGIEALEAAIPVQDVTYGQTESMMPEMSRVFYEDFVTSSAIKRRGLIASAEAERGFVSQSWTGPLDKLQVASERLLLAAKACKSAQVHEDAVHSSEVSRFFLDPARSEGQRLNFAVMSCFAALRAAASDVGLRLQGVRMPMRRDSSGLRLLLEAVRRDFAASRTLALRSGAVSPLTDGCDSFYAAIYCLFEFMDAWLQLQAVVELTVSTQKATPTSSTLTQRGSTELLSCEHA
eukprot:TRINITY_DN68577_c0_g1_i1.p1 TRINITY_DN68577_c0_g1~~TRINITY_DN68577_c0_g1_i1.p1  ORF type:complete len:855 (+),score=107.66 TRINITY_DN68577_c0_g1_i1:64-2628(+)